MQQIAAKELDMHQPAAALHKSNTLYFCGVMVMHLESLIIDKYSKGKYPVLYLSYTHSFIFCFQRLSCNF